MNIFVPLKNTEGLYSKEVTVEEYTTIKKANPNVLPFDNQLECDFYCESENLRKYSHDASPCTETITLTLTAYDLNAHSFRQLRRGQIDLNHLSFSNFNNSVKEFDKAHIVVFVNGTDSHILKNRIRKF